MNELKRKACGKKTNKYSLGTDSDLIQVHVYYARFSGGFSGDQFYFYHGDGRFLGERGKVFNDFFQISRRGVGRVGLAKTAKPFCSKFEKNR